VITPDPHGNGEAEADGLAEFAEETGGSPVACTATEDAPRPTRENERHVSQGSHERGAGASRWPLVLRIAAVLAIPIVVAVLVSVRKPIPPRVAVESRGSPAPAPAVPGPRAVDPAPDATRPETTGPLPASAAAPPATAAAPSVPANPPRSRAESLSDRERITRRAPVSRPSAADAPSPEPNAASVPRLEAADSPPAPIPESAAAAAPPVPAAPAVAATAAIARDETAIRGLLSAYREAYDRLDAVAAARLWPGMDTAGLSRAFGTLSSQQVEFDSCAVDVADVRAERASALCRGSLRYVRRVGSAAPQSRAATWQFQLRRSAERWLIEGVTVK
jgi:hypothetical protein